MSPMASGGNLCQAVMLLRRPSALATGVSARGMCKPVPDHGSHGGRPEFQRGSDEIPCKPPASGFPSDRLASGGGIVYDFNPRGWAHFLSFQYLRNIS